MNYKRQTITDVVAGTFKTSKSFRDWQNGDIHLYSRISDPASTRLEDSFANGCEGGALAFSSGMAAISTLLIYLSRKYNRIVLPKSMYGGSHTLISEFLYGSHFSQMIEIDLSKGEIPPGIEDAVIFLETPANPTLEVADILAWQAVARANNCVLVVDNTLLTHVWQDPVRMGADFSVASATKSISGASDVLAGVVWVGNHEELEKLARFRTYLGTIISPSVAKQLLPRQEGLRDRVWRQSKAAQLVYTGINDWGGFIRCYYPISDERSRSLCAYQSHGLGGCLVTFTPSNNLEEARALLDRLKIIRIATSFGGPSATIQIVNDIDYSTITNSSQCRDLPLVRLSVGDERPEQLIREIVTAWESIKL